MMRHSDYRTTLKHYTVLGLTDTAAAISTLPVATPQPVAKTGTEGVAPVRARGALSGAFQCNSAQTNTAVSSVDRTAQTGTACNVAQRDATEDSEAGEGDRTLDIQLGKLTLYH